MAQKRGGTKNGSDDEADSGATGGFFSLDEPELPDAGPSASWALPAAPIETPSHQIPTNELYNLAAVAEPAQQQVVQVRAGFLNKISITSVSVGSPLVNPSLVTGGGGRGVGRDGHAGPGRSQEEATRRERDHRGARRAADLRPDQLAPQVDLGGALLGQHGGFPVQQDAEAEAPDHVPGRSGKGPRGRPEEPVGPEQAVAQADAAKIRILINRLVRACCIGVNKTFLFVWTRFIGWRRAVVASDGTLAC